MRALVLSLCVGVCLAAFGGVAAAPVPPSEERFPYALEVVRVVPPNLLRNGGFEDAGAGGTPEGWSASNPLQIPRMRHTASDDAAAGKRAARVDSPENAPAYWVQSARVTEGVRYYCSVRARFDGRCQFLLRVFTDQYADAGSWADNTSHTDVRDTAQPGQGEGLEDFLDPVYLRQVSKDAWSTREVEFVVPSGKGVDTYHFSAGIYGIGWALLDDAYFGPAGFGVQGTLKGAGLKELRIVDAGGELHHRAELDPARQTHALTAALLTRLARYFVEVTDAQGKKHRRTLP